MRDHVAEYAIEALLLGLFMVSAGLVTTALEAPGSPLVAALPSDFARRALIGAAMGLTLVSLVYSPLGKRSGAHMNPALTLSYLRLGKVARRDALAYSAAQIAGGVAGVALVAIALGSAFENAPVSSGRDPAGRARRARSVRGRGRDQLRDDDDGARLHQRSAPRPVHRTLLRDAARVVHHLRGSALGDQHEPGAHLCVGALPRLLGRPLGVPRRAAGRDAARGGALRTRARSGARPLREKLNHSARHRCIFCGFAPGPSEA